MSNTFGPIETHTISDGPIDDIYVTVQPRLYWFSSGVEGSIRLAIGREVYNLSIDEVHNLEDSLHRALSWLKRQQDS